MSRICILMFALFFSFKLVATELEYKLTNEKVSFLVQDEVSYTFQQQGFWPLDITQAGSVALIDVDQVFIDSNLKKTIYFKHGIELNKPQTWLQLDKDIVYHTKTPDGVPIALFFEDTTQVQAEILVKKLWVISDDEREIASLNCMSCQSNSFGSIKNISSNISGALNFQNMYSCLVDNIKNELSNAKNTLSSIWEAVKHPIKAWQKIKQMGSEIISVVRTLGAELGEFFKNMAGLGAEVIKYVSCVVAGKVATSIAATVLTGGAAAFKAVAAGRSILLMIKNLNKMKSAIKSISALKNKTHSKKLLNEVLSCGS